MTTALLVVAGVLLLGWSWVPRRRLPPSVGASGERSSPNPTPGHVVRRHRAVDPLALATWCDALARSIRGGATLRQAVASVAPPAAVEQHLSAIGLALERGAPLATALDVGGPVPPHLDLVLVVLRAVATHGGPSAEPIDRVAAALRQRAAMIGERKSHSAQARLSAIVMTLLPGALLIVLVATSRAVREAVISPPGVASLGLGAAANATGWFWMRRLIRNRSAW